MNAKKSLAVCLLLGLGLAARGQAQTFTLQSVADTSLREGAANQSRGGEPVLDLAANQRTLVRFDTAGMAAAVGSGRLVSASLELYVRSATGNWGADGRPVEARRLTAAWTEAGATWNCAVDTQPGNNRPDCSTQWNGGTFEEDSTDAYLQTRDDRRWVQLDVTADVAAFLAGTPNQGWLLLKTEDAGAGRLEYASREGAAAERPRLVLLVESAANDQVPPSLAITSPVRPLLVNEPTPTVTLAYADGGSGVDLAALQLLVDGQDRTASCTAGAQSASCPLAALAAGDHTIQARLRDRAGNAAQASFAFRLLLGTGPHLVTFQATGDTHLRKSQANSPQGADPALSLREGGRSRTLVQFDAQSLASALAGGTLISAFLELHIERNEGNWGKQGRTVDAHRATAAWTEAAATWNCAVDTIPSNNQADCAAQWNGGSFAPAPTASVLHTRDLVGWVSFDVTADVAAFLAGTPSQGWLIKKTEEKKSGRVDYDARQGTAGEGPRLVVVFETAGGGGDTTAPSLAFTEPRVPILQDQRAPQVRLDYADAGSGVEPASLRLRLEGQDVTATCTVGAAAATCQLPTLSTAASGASEHPLEAEILDRAGNRTTAALTLLLILGGGDTAAPQVVISAPAPGALVNRQPIAVSGMVLDDGVVQLLKVNGVPVPFDGGAFTAEAPLAEGENSIVVRVTDGSGKSAAAEVLVTLDATPPQLVVESPPAGLVNNSDTVVVSGTVADKSGVARVTVDGVEVPVVDGAFSGTAALPGASRSIVVTATDVAGNETTVTREVSRFILPRVAITAPADLSSTTASVITVSGTVEGTGATVEVNDVPAQVSGGTFTATGVPLIAGPNLVTAVAVDAAGHANTSTIVVLRDVTQPKIAIYAPRDGAVVAEAAVPVHGFVSDQGEGALDVPPPVVTVNGVPAVFANETFFAPSVPLTPGLNTLTVTATDAAGNRREVSVTVRYEPAPGRRVRIVSGNLQSGGIGAALPEPLVVQVLDDAGQPVADRPVLFTARGNDGSFPGGLRQVAVPTDAQGHAAVGFTLGTRAGAGNQLVEAFVAGYLGPAVFTLTALHGAPALLVTDAGDQQVAIADQRLPLALAAAVTDAGFNRLADVPVRFEVVAGGGSFEGGGQVVVETDHLGRAVVSLRLGPGDGIGNNVVEATVVGSEPSLRTSFTASGRIAGDPALTSIRGVVIDNSNQPVPNATLRILDTSITTTTDAEGRFLIQPAPVGTVKLIVDGSTTTRPGTWPDLEYVLTTIPGRENTVGMPIYLLPLEMGNSLPVDETRGGRITLPDFPGFALDIAPGSVTFPSGSRSGLISVTVVHADKVPMIPNFGQQPRFIVTIQPANAIFEPSARLTLPNLDGLAPGAVTEMYSFDHDLGRFVSIGLATVSDDGTVVASNPGGGVRKAGWHCGGNPSGSGTTHNCPTCQTCVNNRCAPDDGQAPPQNAPHDCKREICYGGTPRSVPDIHEIPFDVVGNCSDGVCTGAGPDLRTNLSDAPAGRQCCDTGRGSGGTAFDPQTSCCEAPRILPKRPIDDLAACPNRVPWPQHQPGFNGCTRIPDNPNLCAPSFLPACNNHDVCYDTCNNTQAACDQAFLNDMLAICATVSNVVCRTECQANAQAYALAVRNIGSLFYEPAQRNACQCCP